MLIARFGVRDVAMRAVLDALLQIHKVSAAFVAESIERATAKHTVEIVAAYFVAGEIFTRIVFEIGAVVFHGISLCIAFFLPSIILHFLCKKQELRQKFFGKYQIFFKKQASGIAKVPLILHQSLSHKKTLAFGLLFVLAPPQLLATARTLNGVLRTLRHPALP